MAGRREGGSGREEDGSEQEVERSGAGGGWKREAEDLVGRREGGRGLNFNVFNLRKQSTGCFRETTKDLRKTIRHLEKTTKHLEKIIRQVVAPSSSLFFGKSGQKETEEALR